MADVTEGAEALGKSQPSVSRSMALLEARIGLHPRATADFLDALVALGLLERDGAGRTALYANTPEGAVYLDRASPRYVGGLLEMANARLYPFWGELTAALRAEAAPVPTAFTARTSNVYAVPLVSPVTAADVASPTAWVRIAVVPVPE